MPWFKVDDTLHSHPKPRRAGLAAYGLWSLAGSYSMAYKLDGFVPDDYVAGWRGGAAQAAALVKVGAWKRVERDGEWGYQFHNWEHFQPSSDEIERDREHARLRQQRRREKQREARAKTGDKP